MVFCEVPKNEVYFNCDGLPHTRQEMKNKIASMKEKLGGYTLPPTHPRYNDYVQLIAYMSYVLETVGGDDVSTDLSQFQNWQRLGHF